MDDDKYDITMIVLIGNIVVITLLYIIAMYLNH